MNEIILNLINHLVEKGYNKEKLMKIYKEDYYKLYNEAKQDNVLKV
jgi:hypothetical protein